MKRCVVTGATGLIGTHLAERLHRGWRIAAVARTATAPLPNVEPVRIDLSTRWDTQALPARVDAVIHLAQSEHYRDFPERAADVFRVNTASTVRLLDYARRAGARIFVLASSGGVYGHGPDPLAEDAPTPVGHDLPFYLGTRLASELLARDYASFMHVIVLRFFFVYGPGQRPGMLIPRLVHAVMSGQPIVLHGRDGMRLNPTCVDDAAAAVERALELGSSHTINVGGPDVLTLRQIGDRIGDAVTHPPRFAVQTDAEPRHLAGDIGLMTRLLGHPRIPFAEGIRRYVASLGSAAVG